MDSGSIDVGSIPTWGTKSLLSVNKKIFINTMIFFFFPKKPVLQGIYIVSILGSFEKHFVPDTGIEPLPFSDYLLTISFSKRQIVNFCTPSARQIVKR